MKKITLILLMAAAVQVHAQSSKEGSAVQSAKLVMSNAIDISVNSNNGDIINLAFENVNDYANGVESSPVQLKVRSNKKFEVSAKTSSNLFTYNGSTSPAPKMSVNNLLIKVVSNNTGGSVPNNVNNKYRKMKKSNSKLIKNGTPGGNNTFTVRYKADPGFEFPAGTYTVDVIYTATQK